MSSKLSLAIGTSVILCTLTACNSTTNIDNSTNTETQEQLATISQNTATISSDVQALNNLIISLNEKQEEQLNSCSALSTEQNKHIKELKSEIANLKSTINNHKFQNNNENINMIKSNASNQKLADGKMIFGELEWIYVADADMSFESRIDSGASVSSISAVNIESFERDGKKWMRFKIPLNDTQLIPIEAPFVRNAIIRQSNSSGSTVERPIVRLNVKVGDLTTSSTFSLIDRSKMQYALLIGREFIKDIAVVDVSRKYVQNKLTDKNSVSGLKQDKEERILPNTRNIDIKDKKDNQVIQAKPKDDTKNPTSTNVEDNKK